MKRVLVVLLVVVTMFGAVTPPAEAYVVAPPPPVMLPPVTTAPPALGLCSTPLGVLICAGFVGAAIAHGWTYDEEVDVRGLGYVEDAQGNRWEICEYTKSGEMRCAGDWSGGGSTWDPPAVKSQYENLEALKEYGWYPPQGADNYVSPLDRETTLVVPRYQSHYEDALAVGAEFLGGWAHLSEGGRQLTIEVFFRTENPCPRVERDTEWMARGSNEKLFPEWVSCTGITMIGGARAGAGAPEAGALNGPEDVTCSEGGVPTFYGYAGGTGSGVTVTCPPGTVIESIDYSGPTEPNPSANVHFRFAICSIGPQGYTGPSSLFSNCEYRTTAPRVNFAVTMTEDEVPSRQAVMHTWCRAEDGSLTLRTSYGPEIPVFIDEVPIPNPDCGPGEVPVKWEAEVCEVPPLGEDCVRAGSGEIPGIDEMTDAELSCVQRLATPNPCPMWLEKWNGAEWEYCDPAAANCVGWWNHPDREIVFRCGWGGTYYSASQCVALKDFYDVEEGGDVATQPDPALDPDPDPTAIGTDRITVVGPQNPVSARPNMPWWKRVITEWATGSTADMQNSCWPQGWGLLNPLQWVLRPIMCALTWAFVPTTSVQARLENIRDAWEARTGLVPEVIPQVTAPVVQGACGWGFDAVDTPEMGVIPEVDIIWCPEEHGVSSQAALMRGLGLGGLGLMVIAMLMRWVSMRSSHEAGPDTGFQGSFS